MHMNVTVLLGGASSERDVSLASGLRIAHALRDAGHTVTCVDPAQGEMTRAKEEALRAAGDRPREVGDDLVGHDHRDRDRDQGLAELLTLVPAQ